MTFETVTGERVGTCRVCGLPVYKGQRMKVVQRSSDVDLVEHVPCDEVSQALAESIRRRGTTPIGVPGKIF